MKLGNLKADLIATGDSLRDAAHELGRSSIIETMDKEHVQVPVALWAVVMAELHSQGDFCLELADRCTTAANNALQDPEV